jgi:predicted TIM-barrel fold metal-dependent hydrolase
VCARTDKEQLMKWIVASLVFALAATGCHTHQTAEPGTSAAPGTAVIQGPFTEQELAQFVALAPIDTHTHILQSAPAFLAMLQKLNLHVLDILVVTTPGQKGLDTQRQQAWQFVRASDGRATLCSTFDPSLFARHDFSRTAIAEINRDFAQGAIAVKIWKTIGEQLQDAKGRYLMADDPVFEPTYKDIAAHDKTLVAHLADPNSIWEAPNPASPDYSYYHVSHPEWYMYQRPNAPSKEAILRARDHVLEINPKLRVVGAHLGSMESDFQQIGQHLDRYPNFAVDMAARMPYMAMQPRAEIIRFIEKYQDRLIYATDNGFSPYDDVLEAVPHWESVYALDWRFLATNDTIEYKGRKVQGLALPVPILRKIYHDNAVKWFPGILANGQ